MRPPFLLLSLIAAGGAIAAEPLTDPTATLGAFTKELQGQIRGGNSDENYRSQIVMQFKQLESALKRGDYERAQQTLQNLGGYGGIPPALQEQWSALADKLAEQIESQRQQAYLKWKTEVDELAKRMREACLQAKTTDDLDPILIACAQLQTRRVNESNIIAQRASQRIQAIAYTLENWARFLDARAAGNGAAANAALRQLSEPNNGISILTSRDLAPFTVPSTPPARDINDLITPAIASVTKMGDLPAAVDRLRQLNGALLPEGSQDLKLDEQIASIETLLAASRAADEGKWDEAARTLKLAQAKQMAASIRTMLTPLMDGLAGRLAVQRISNLVNIPAQPGETESAFLKRVADEFAAARKFAELLSFIATVYRQPFIEQSSTKPEYPWRREDATALDAFLLGQRLEAATDLLPAIVQYRLAVTTGQGSRYVPVDEAQASLKRLLEAHPDLQKSPNNLILQELQELREQLRNIQSRFPSGTPLSRPSR